MRRHNLRNRFRLVDVSKAVPVLGVLAVASGVSRAADIQHTWSGASNSNWSTTSSWADINADTVGDVADDTDLGDTNNVVVRTTNFTSQRTIVLDSNRTVAKVWYNTDGAGADGSTANGGLTIGGTATLTLAANGATPQFAAGRINDASGSTITVNTVLAGNQGFTVLQEAGPYTGGGFVLGNANTISGNVSGYRLMTLRNVNALQNASLQLAGGGTLNLRSDSDGTFTTAGITQGNSTTPTTINVNEATVGGGGGTAHVLKLGGNYSATTTNGRNITVTGANNYSLELTGTYTNSSATQAGKINASSANVKLSGSTVAIGFGLDVGSDAATPTGVNEITGSITGVGRINKLADASVWKFSGANTYSGNTTVGGGKLIVNGTTTGQGNYSFGPITADTTLGGEGALGLAADKTVGIAGTSSSALAILDVGDSTVANTIGTLTVTTSGAGKTVFGDYGVLSIELNGEDIDLLDVGALDLTSALDGVHIAASGVHSVNRYVFATYTGSLGGNTFNTELFTGLTGASIDYSVDGEIAVLIPEPSVALLLGGLALPLLSRRRVCGSTM